MAQGVVVQNRLREQVAEEVRALLARRRLNGAKLAEAIGRSEMYVSRRLRAETAFDLDDLQNIAETLGVPVLQLLPAGGAGGDRVQAIAHYLAPTVRTIEPPTRPRDNRPSGHPFAGAQSGARRTAPLPRNTRPKAS
jgi:transcriptional regulator with XRE-family HTH domain